MTTAPLPQSVIASALAIEATHIVRATASGNEPLALAVHDAATCQVVR